MTISKTFLNTTLGLGAAASGALDTFEQVLEEQAPKALDAVCNGIGVAAQTIGENIPSPAPIAGAVFNAVTNAISENPLGVAALTVATLALGVGTAALCMIREHRRHHHMSGSASRIPSLPSSREHSRRNSKDQDELADALPSVRTRRRALT